MKAHWSLASACPSGACGDSSTFTRLLVAVLLCICLAYSVNLSRVSWTFLDQTLAVNIKEHCTTWIVDSGATGHMTSCSSWMVNTQPVQVALGTADSNSKELVATLRGDVVLSIASQSRKPTKMKLSNVLYSPNLCANILSVGALKAKGVQTDFSSNTISKGNTRICIDWVGKLPYLHVQESDHIQKGAAQVSMPSPSTCLTVSEEDAMQLHLQYGHASITALRKMHPDKVPPDLHAFDCPSCFMGKSKQVSFPTTATFRSVRPLECVHSDIWGPCLLCTLPCLSSAVSPLPPPPLDCLDPKVFVLRDQSSLGSPLSMHPCVCVCLYTCASPPTLL